MSTTLAIAVGVLLGAFGLGLALAVRRWLRTRRLAVVGDAPSLRERVATMGPLVVDLPEVETGVRTGGGNAPFVGLGR